MTPATQHSSRCIGGSLLPSGGSDTYKPMEFGTTTFEVRPSVELDTHFLLIHHEDGTSKLAEHPNGHSCRALAERMVSGDAVKVEEQRQYIERCGGMVRPKSVFDYFLETYKVTKTEEVAITIQQRQTTEVNTSRLASLFKP